MKQCYKRMLVVVMLFAHVVALSACDSKTNQRSQMHANAGARTTITGMPTITPRNQRQTSGNVKPWENGGKAVSEYTWAEFEALSPELKELFFDAFGSVDAFEAWRRAASVINDESRIVEPWRNGGKSIYEYTWAEFESLSPEQKELFFDAFGSVEAFSRWMSEVQD